MKFWQKNCVLLLPYTAILVRNHDLGYMVCERELGMIVGFLLKIVIYGWRETIVVWEHSGTLESRKTEGGSISVVVLLKEKEAALCNWLAGHYWVVAFFFGSMILILCCLIFAFPAFLFIIFFYKISLSKISFHCVWLQNGDYFPFCGWTKDTKKLVFVV